MSSAYGRIDRAHPAPSRESLILQMTLKDGTKVRVRPVNGDDEDEVEYCRLLLNAEIIGGSTYPQEHPLNQQQFRDYFLSYDAFAVELLEDNVDLRSLDEQLLGCFYIKPNFPGRCAHICNGGFVTVPAHRNRGVGHVMAKAFISLAPRLGYKASMFNLVFENNRASVKLWRSMGFKELGRIPQAGRLVNSPGHLVDALIFGYQFS